MYDINDVKQYVLCDIDSVKEQVEIAINRQDEILCHFSIGKLIVLILQAKKFEFLSPAEILALENYRDTISDRFYDSAAELDTSANKE